MVWVANENLLEEKLKKKRTRYLQIEKIIVKSVFK
jgi:hypothetical protein